MEPDAKRFLVKVMKSFSIAALWLLMNMTFGIFFDYGFIHSALTFANILFYLFFLASLSAMIWYLLNLWKEQLRA